MQVSGGKVKPSSKNKYIQQASDIKSVTSRLATQSMLL